MSQFSKEESGQLIKIRCPKSLDAAAAQDFNDQTKSWMLSPVSHFVFDFTGVETIERDFYKSIILLKTNLKKDQKSIYSLNMSPGLIKQIKEHGVELAFNPIKSIEGLMVKPTASAAQSGAKGLDVAFINPFLTATQKTLEVQAQTKLKVLKPYLKTGPVDGVAIASVLALASNNFTGSVVLCFSDKVFLKIYENMFGEKHEKITTELEDAAGELLNIIYGMAKVELNQNGYNFPKALPTVLAGDKIKIRQSGTKPAVIIPFETEVGQFHVEVEFNKD